MIKYSVGFIRLWIIEQMWEKSKNWSNNVYKFALALVSYCRTVCFRHLSWTIFVDLWFQIVGSGILYIVMHGNPEERSLIKVLEPLLSRLSHSSWAALDVKVMWNSKRPVWFQVSSNSLLNSYEDCHVVNSSLLILRQYSTESLICCRIVKVRSPNQRGWGHSHNKWP